MYEERKLERRLLLREKEKEEKKKKMKVWLRVYK